MINGMSLLDTKEFTTGFEYDRSTELDKESGDLRIDVLLAELYHKGNKTGNTDIGYVSTHVPRQI